MNAIIVRQIKYNCSHLAIIFLSVIPFVLIPAFTQKRNNLDPDLSQGKPNMFHLLVVSPQQNRLLGGRHPILETNTAQTSKRTSQSIDR